MELLTDLPGYSVRNVTIIVKTEDSDNYGNVEKVKIINWGIPVSYQEKIFPRALCSDE